MLWKRLIWLLLIVIALGLVFLSFEMDTGTEMDASTEVPLKSSLIREFDHLDSSFNNGQGCIGYTNEDGSLAWAESYLLLAYLDMYEATGDMKYLQKFVSQADWVYNNTDKARGIKDYKGRMRIGWSSTKHSKDNERVVHIVHTGMIVYPLARFSQLVKNTPSLAAYTEQAQRYTRLAQEAVAEFDHQWIQRTNEGFYMWEGDEPIEADLSSPDALNSYTALGRVIVLLYRLTGNESYLVKAAGIAKYFKNDISLLPDGSYAWHYRASVSPQLEDISHGAIDIGFAHEAYKAGIVFNREDMLAFAKTIKNAKRGTGFSRFVDGSGEDIKMMDSKCGQTWERTYSDAVGRWLDLASVDRSMYDIAYGYLIHRQISDPQIILGIAKIVKYRR